MFFRKMKEMQSLINSRTRALKLAESRIDNRNKFIAYQKEQIRKQEERIKDLENNVEFLFNNLTPMKKKLARPDNQN